MELVTLDDDDRTEFMSDLGISEPAVDLVIQKSYSLLGLISYLTAGEPEVRAWTIKRGTNAQKAAGVIHSDIERGFIRAEVTAYDDYIEHQTAAALKAAGKTRLEGKEYIVADGDVILFRFAV
jgi:ribosome-binding ATPase YchF (GTP1/OBG family)